MILNKCQAEAVYNAMCALNNVSMRVEAHIGSAVVYETTSGAVVVDAYAVGSERYETQHAFAVAYGLQDE